MASVTDMCSSLQGYMVRDREREKTSKTREDYVSVIREQCYISEPIETKYFKLFFQLMHTNYIRY
jgi:hypothetical protein